MDRDRYIFKTKNQLLLSSSFSKNVLLSLWLNIISDFHCKEEKIRDDKDIHMNWGVEWEKLEMNDTHSEM